MDSKLTKRDNLVAIHLEEYKALRDEMLKKIEFEHSFLNYAIVIPTAFFTILSTQFLKEDHEELLLFSPIIFYALGLVYASTDDTIISIATYLNTILRPKLVELLADKDILGYEEYVFMKRTVFERSFVGRLYSVAKNIIVVVAPIGIIYFYVQRYWIDKHKTFSGLPLIEACLLIFDILMVIIIVFIRLKSWDLKWKVIVPQKRQNRSVRSR